MKKKKKKITYTKGEKIASFIFVILMLVMGIISLYCAYKDSKWFGRPTTTASFNSCGESEVNESGPTTYKASYTYYVKEEPYKAVLSLTAKECKKEPLKEINYNPDNPSEYHTGNVLFSFILLLIAGILMTLTSLSLIVITFLPDKKKEA